MTKKIITTSVLRNVFMVTKAMDLRRGIVSKVTEVRKVIMYARYVLGVLLS